MNIGTTELEYSMIKFRACRTSALRRWTIAEKYLFVNRRVMQGKSHLFYPSYTRAFAPLLIINI